MPSSRSDWDDDVDVDAFSSSSRSSTSWIASEGMTSEDNLEFLWSGVEVSVSVSISEDNGGSDGSGTVGEESEWEDEVLVEENFDFDESLEIGVGVVENDVNEVDRVVEGGGFDLNSDSVEELVQGYVREEADWVDERVVPVSFGDFVEEECDLGESLEFFQELEGSGGAEQDHVTVVVDLEETLGVDGNSLANSSDVVDNSNLEGDFDFSDSLGSSGDGMEEAQEGHTFEESLDFVDNTPSEGDINLEDNNPSSDGLSWGFVDSLRGVSRDDVILGDYVVFEQLDNAGSFEQIFDQIMRSDIRRRRAATSAAAKDIVERLPVMEVNEGMFKGSDSDGACAVCKNNVQVGERVRSLPCLHYFHEECIIPWLEIRNTCPLCRHELPTEDARNEGIRRRRVDSGSREGGSSPNQLL